MAVSEAMAEEEERSVFVTVGTTRFDELIATVLEEVFLKVRTNKCETTLLYVLLRLFLRIIYVCCERNVSLLS